VAGQLGQVQVVRVPRIPVVAVGVVETDTSAALAVRALLLFPALQGSADAISDIPQTRIAANPIRSMTHVEGSGTPLSGSKYPTICPWSFIPKGTVSVPTGSFKRRKNSTAIEENHLLVGSLRPEGGRYNTHQQFALNC